MYLCMWCNGHIAYISRINYYYYFYYYLLLTNMLNICLSIIIVCVIRYIHRRSTYSPYRPGPTLHLKNEKSEQSKFAIQIEGGWGSVALSDPLKVVQHKSVRMHHLASLLSNLSLQVKISYQNVILHAFTNLQASLFSCFHIFPTVPTRFKQRGNACIRYIVFNYFS